MKNATKKKQDSRLVSMSDAAEMLGGLSPRTIAQRKGGTEHLTHVPGFGRRVFLIRSEVEALVAERIERARADHRKMFRLVGKNEARS